MGTVELVQNETTLTELSVMNSNVYTRKRFEPYIEKSEGMYCVHRRNHSVIRKLMITEEIDFPLQNVVPVNPQNIS